MRKGGCLCGLVRYTISGDPIRAGLCHCADCRKLSGSNFVAFGVWPRRNLLSTGEISTFAGRSFCPNCGSRIFSLRPDEAEIMLGSLDNAPNELRPSYEIWTKRREPWLEPVDTAAQFDEDEK